MAREDSPMGIIMPMVTSELLIGAMGSFLSG